MPTPTALALAMAAALQAAPAAAPEACNLALATKVHLTALAKAPQAWAGRCVAVDGYWRHRALFDTPRDARRERAQSGPALKARRIGVYVAEALLSSAPAQPVPYTAVGVAGTCEALGEGALMVTGYCHYTGGAYIAAAEMHRR